VANVICNVLHHQKFLCKSVYNIDLPLKDYMFKILSCGIMWFFRPKVDNYVFLPC